MRLVRSTFQTCVFVAAILVSACIAAAGISPIPDITVQTLRGHLSSPPYAWWYSYDIGYCDYEVNVEMDIHLQGADPGADLLSTWENGIEDMWSRKFDIIDTSMGSPGNPYHYHVNFDVLFPSDPAAFSHHTVTVIAGTGRGDMLHWYTTTEWGSEYNGAYVAHEVGHMFGLYDEYQGGAVDPLNPIIDYTSIMGSLAWPAKDRHYGPFLNWLEQMAPTHELEIGPYDPFWEVPEPSTLVLLGLGILLNKVRGRHTFPFSFKQC